jgi:hypothetical protein
MLLPVHAYASPFASHLQQYFPPRASGNGPLLGSDGQGLL